MFTISWAVLFLYFPTHVKRGVIGSSASELYKSATKFGKTLTTGHI
jgi:hypothetical protein